MMAAFRSWGRPFIMKFMLLNENYNKAAIPFDAALFY